MKIAIFLVLFFIYASFCKANYLSLENINRNSFSSFDLGEIKFSFSQEKPGNCTTPVEIGADEAYDFIISKNPIIIDIRTHLEYEEERLENVSYNIDFYAEDFKAKLNELDKNAKYLIYCRTGRRTGLALEIMKELGFKDIHHIKGGIVDWKAKGYPTVKGAPSK